MSLEDDGAQKKSKDQLNVPHENTPSSERLRPFSGRRLEQIPEFRTLMLTALELGAKPKDIVPIVRECVLGQGYVPPHAGQITQYVTKTLHESKDAPSTLERLRARSPLDSTLTAAYPVVYEYMRTHRPGRLWRFARNAKAVAACLLKNDNLSAHAVGRGLTKYLDAEIGRMSVDNVIDFIQQSVKSESPELRDAQARKLLIQQLEDGLSTEEMERGAEDSTEIETLMRIEQFARSDSWLRNEKARLLVATLDRKHVLPLRTTARIAAETIGTMYGVAVSPNGIRSYLFGRKGRKAAILDEYLDAALPQALRQAEADAQLAIENHLHKRPGVLKETSAATPEAAEQTRELQNDPLVRSITETITRGDLSGAFFSLAEQSRIINAGKKREKKVTELIISLHPPAKKDHPLETIEQYALSVQALKKILTYMQEGIPSALAQAILHIPRQIRIVSLRWPEKNPNAMQAFMIGRSLTFTIPVKRQRLSNVTYPEKGSK